MFIGCFGGIKIYVSTGAKKYEPKFMLQHTLGVIKVTELSDILLYNICLTTWEIFKDCYEPFFERTKKNVEYYG